MCHSIESREAMNTQAKGGEAVPENIEIRARMAEREYMLPRR